MPDPNPQPHSPLVVITGSPDGRVLVASDTLLSQLSALDHLGEALRLSAGELVGVLERMEVSRSIASEVPTAAIDARRVMDAALHALLAAQARAGAIREGVLRSLRAYDHVEQDALAAVHFVNERLAWGLGQLVRVLGVPLGIAGIEGLAITCAIFGMSPPELATAAQNLLRAHGRILTSPLTVAVIREMASDVDGFSAGLTGVPLEGAAALEATGATGVPSSAAQVVALGNVAGFLTETPVSVRKTSSFEFGRPATSLVDRSNSFPDPHDDPNNEQIRIDRYTEPGKPDRFDVYIAGTVTFDPKSAKEPFDFTSDLTGVANESPGSLRAVREAMAQAGVTSSSAVVLNGYSQGGLVASLVAASGDYNVKGVVTFGAPSAQVHLPASIPVLTVRNTEDLVPATSGYDVNPHAVIVQRSVFANSPVPSDWAVPAHRLSYYQETAAVVDAASSSQVRSVLDPLNSFGAGAQRVDSALWVATRVAGGSSGGSGLPAREAAGG